MMGFCICRGQGGWRGEEVGMGVCFWGFGTVVWSILYDNSSFL